MPSGAKKRKKAAAAAKNKEEGEKVGINQPTSSLQPQDKELEEMAEMDSSEETHHDGSDVEIEFVHSKDEKTSVCERPNEILLEKMSGEASISEDSLKDVGNEFIETKEVVEACVCERPNEILLEKMSEEAPTSESTVKDARSEFVESKEGVEACEDSVRNMGSELIETKEVVEACVCERPKEILLDKMSEEVPTSENTVKDVGSEFVESKEGVEACVCERPNEILLEKMSEEASTSEETVKDVDIWFAENNEVVEASDDSLHYGCEDGGELPNMGTVIDISVPDPTNEEGTALLERCAWIWNCCGLLDVFKGLKDDTR